VFTVDNGEESGGQSGRIVRELRKLPAGFGSGIIQHHKEHRDDNGHLERSHRTVDEEFYMPRVFKFK
jgi:hypothetical protein